MQPPKCQISLRPAHVTAFQVLGRWAGQDQEGIWRTSWRSTSFALIAIPKYLKHCYSEWCCEAFWRLWIESQTIKLCCFGHLSYINSKRVQNDCGASIQCLFMCCNVVLVPDQRCECWALVFLIVCVCVCVSCYIPRCFLTWSGCVSYGCVGVFYPVVYFLK